MKSFTYQWAFFFFIYIKHGYNYPTGAPNSICTTMMPDHGVTARQCSSKYTIRSDKSQFYLNETVRITVNGSTSADTFRGILLTAKTPTSGQIIGTWTVVGTTTRAVNCNNVVNTGITHSSRDDKSSIEAVWSPPSTIFDATTIIRATVVTVRNEIYVNCFNITLNARQVNQSSIATTAIPMATTTLPTTTVPPTTDVGVTISWTYTNGVTAVKMQINNLKTAQWIALGLSLDQNMGEDHVFVCKRLINDTIAVERRINPGGRLPPVPASTMSNPGGTFTVNSKRFDNGVTYCEFSLSNFTGSKRRRRAISSLSQSTTYYPLIAIGNLDSSNEMIRHTSRSALSQNVQLNQPGTINYNGNDSDRVGLMKAHGIIMIFTWILFVSTGILLARYFKPSWPDQQICGKPIWFAAHRVIMTSVAVLTIVAFILILVYEKGTWVPQDDKLPFSHSIVGIIVISFAVIQPVMALFRCKPDAHYRFIFNYVHATVGLTAFILSVVAIFLAMFFDRFNFQDNGVWGILVAWSCWLPIIFLIFWCIDFYFKKKSLQQVKTESYDLNDRDPNTALPNDPVDIANNVKRDRIKGIFLCIHILIAFGLALALAILVGTT